MLLPSPIWVQRFWVRIAAVTASGVSFDEYLDGLEHLDFSKMEFLAAVTTNNEAPTG